MVPDTISPATGFNIYISLRENIHRYSVTTGNLLLKYSVDQKVSSVLCVLSWSVVSDSLRPHGLYPARLLCPWGFSRQQYWSGLPCPFPGDLPNPGIKPGSPVLQVDSLPSEPPGSPRMMEWVLCCA